MWRLNSVLPWRFRRGLSPVLLCLLWKSFLKQNFHSMMTLPFYLFVMTALAAILTLHTMKYSDNFRFIIIGLLVGSFMNWHFLAKRLIELPLKTPDSKNKLSLSHFLRRYLRPCAGWGLCCVTWRSATRESRRGAALWLRAAHTCVAARADWRVGVYLQFKTSGQHSGVRGEPALALGRSAPSTARLA